MAKKKITVDSSNFIKIPRTAEMKCIYRRTSGWELLFSHKGKNYLKYFGDRIYHNSAQLSLAAAKRYRTKIFKKIDKVLI